jgi:hypothetical protein
MPLPSLICVRGKRQKKRGLSMAMAGERHRGGVRSCIARALMECMGAGGRAEG